MTIEQSWKDELARRQDAAHTLQTELAAALNLRDAGIRAALREGAGVSDVCRWTGLSRERVYQVKTGRKASSDGTGSTRGQ